MTYQELISHPDYKELCSVSHGEVKTIILAEITKNNCWARVANMYQITGILAFILGAFKAFMPFFVYRQWVDLVCLGVGIVFTFSFLILLHELIHALAYRLVGVRNLSFGYNLRKFMFYVEADRQVINHDQFKKVALAPAVVIGALSVAGMIFFYNQPPFYFFLTIFSFHSLFCSGDFGLLCFFENRDYQEVLTFDVKDEGRMYFYGKNQTTSLKD
jgi:hypothetical protein